MSSRPWTVSIGEHLGRTGCAGGLDGTEADRAQAEHGGGVAAAQSRVSDRVVAGAEHVPGEQGDPGGHALGNGPEREVGVGHEQPLGLRALEIAELAAVPECATVHAAVVVPADARRAGPARGTKAAEHPLADRYPLDLRAGREDRADELVADREALLDRDAAVEDVQVRAADAARLDLHDRVVGTLDLRLGDLLHANLAWGLKGDGAHLRVHPTLCRRTDAACLREKLHRRAGTSNLEALGVVHAIASQQPHRGLVADELGDRSPAHARRRRRRAP